ncbi:MAG: rsbT antagonist protein RsbS [Chlamydiales bacterium]|jgi:rsbT antagonist protein RsbS
MQLSRDVIVASIQVDLDDDVLARFQEDLLGRVHEKGPRAVILDVSGLETVDSEEFAALRRIIKMVTIMGTESVLVGLQPGVVSALIEVGADVEGLQTAIDLDAAFALLEPAPEPEPDSDSDPDPDSEVVDGTTDTPEGFPHLDSEGTFKDER